MNRFINDYSEGAHPRVLELLMKSNLEQNTGYGEDIHSELARKYMKDAIKREDVDIHFISGGTQTNFLAISSFLRPHQCVIAADTGHINVHETGAVEATGHKVVTAAGKDGKLTAKAIRDICSYHSDEHMVQPKMVYLSDTTELGTVYTRAELTAIHDICKELGLILYLDGARLGSALTSKANDLKLKDIAELTDAFYVGGTKNGALLGEALVICREDLKEDFRYLMKQKGAMLAKGFVIGIQFEALFCPVTADKAAASNQDLLYFSLGKHANRMAEIIADALKECGYSFYASACSNQLFPIVPNEIADRLYEEFHFSIQAKIDEKHTAIRLVTSWATSEEAARELAEFFLKNRI